ncbi:MAG: POTRA domain-containing protein, partial [Chitinophagaceae bacterium]
MRIIASNLFIALILWGSSIVAQTDTTAPVSVDPELLNILNSKLPKKYVIEDIKVTGAKFFDPAIVISVSGLAVGDEVTLPGGDAFAKAINRLWQQKLFSAVNIYIIKLEGRAIWLEIVAKERPTLSAFHFKGVRNSEADELKTKSGVFENRVVTENMRLSALENIQKYYVDKGYKNVKVDLDEIPDPKAEGKVIINFNIRKGDKVRIEDVHFFGVENVSEQKLKAQLKGTKEMSNLTLFPSVSKSVYGEIKKKTFKDFVKEKGFFHPTKILEFLDPWFRFKLLSNSKFNEKKYNEDKEKVLAYLNSQGYRDAQIIADTQYLNSKGNLIVDFKIDEGNKYYFGNLTWKGNTKYTDSILQL